MRVDIRGVDEGPPGLHIPVEDGMRGRLVGLVTEGHGSETEDTHLEARSQCSLLHEPRIGRQLAGDSHSDEIRLTPRGLTCAVHVIWC